MVQTESVAPKPQFILDTSPLITLCTFKVSKRLAIEHILPVCELVIPETVAVEATANPAHSDAATVLSRLKAGQIDRIPNPKTAFDPLIDGYTKLGQGERDTIRLALTRPGIQIVLDDHLALVVAMRFGVETILLLDLLVLLVREYGLSRVTALELVNNIAPRYSTPFVEHTRYKLREVQE